MTEPNVYSASATCHKLTMNNFSIVLNAIISDNKIQQWPTEISGIIEDYIKGIIEWKSVDCIHCDDKTGDPLPESSQTRYFAANSDLKDVIHQLASDYYPKLSHRLSYKSSPDGNTMDPRDCIRLWAPLQFLFQIFCVDNGRGITVTKQDLHNAVISSNDSLDRWTEIPDDSLSEITVETVPTNVSLMIERRRFIDDDSKLENGSIECTEDLWPRHKVNPELLPPIRRIGDMIDALDLEKIWYQSVVVCSHNESQKICIRYIGWHIKWAEWVSINAVGKIANRGRYTKKIYRKQQRFSDLTMQPLPTMVTEPTDNTGDVAQYWDQLQTLHAMGFTNANTNIAALQISDGNVGAAVDRLMGD